MFVEPDGAVLWKLEDPRLRWVAAVCGVLDCELGPCPIGGGEEHGGSSGDLVGEPQLAQVRGRDVLSAEDVVAIAYDWWARFPVAGLVVSRHRVRTARWRGEDCEVLPTADTIVEVGEEGVVEEVVLQSPPVRGAVVHHVDLEPAGGEEG